MLKDVARVVSEVPTRLDTVRTRRWLPADCIPNDTFSLPRDGTKVQPLTRIVASLDSRSFQQIVQCVNAGSALRAICVL